MPDPSKPVPLEARNFNAPHPDRPGVTVGEDLADQNMALAFKLRTAEIERDNWREKFRMATKPIKGAGR